VIAFKLFPLYFGADLLQSADQFERLIAAPPLIEFLQADDVLVVRVNENPPHPTNKIPAYHTHIHAYILTPTDIQTYIHECM
jgi:hypothetical protein